MEFLDVYRPKSELFTFLPLETSANLSQQHTVTVIGAIDKDVDVIAQMQDAFNNFIESGQVWALLIGFALGYIFRNMTAY
ncbi:hypothetical protein HC931_17315 [Candidatus Gracilibacteria bacterium]|jgi:hypothetical protein|nr:hypothetical protein [Candidatus Gracilibacteria bacterium]NJM87989.1 hypothetical protein [Hydrococcus sp. RU_2_2]NJP21366.1 hypothetical protein [Hydrococcus sp. CRU_1_1]NJQ98083.1 hypothetical protein [Hydrococcus sp. CSU_1_8]